MAKDKEEKSGFAEVAQMSPEQRAERTHKKAVWNSLVALNQAIHEAKKAGVNIGNVAELDCAKYFDAVRQNEKLDRVSKGPYEGR